MSVIQSTQPELRYLKRQNLKQEANVIGNYYRDIIRSYGVDVTYNKLDTSYFDNFKGIVDKNAIIRQAYGYDIQPDYNMSAHMLAYMEVENDIFQLNKFGLNPEATVNFYFDSTDFACDLACKLGQYQEVKIDETEIDCEVPDMDDKTAWPYQLGVGYVEQYFSNGLSGKLYAEIDRCEYGKELTVQCWPYEHTEMLSTFSANPSLYKAFKHQYQSDHYLDTFLTLIYTITKLPVGRDIHGKECFKSILHGKLHGSVLFYNLNKIGKYIDKIHPEVGDLVTIDFPDDGNLEKYEITDCFDKQLTNDGISPLLHKYIWKCKARRYVNNYDGVEQNEADSRLEEKIKLDNVIESNVADQVELYTDNQDKVYGGYDNKDLDYDKQKIEDRILNDKEPYIDDGAALDVMCFANGTKLVTDGYELMFIDTKCNMTRVAADSSFKCNAAACSDGATKWLKASKDLVIFNRIDGTSFKIVEDETSTDSEVPLQIDDLLERTLDVKKANQRAEDFYKFRNCRTVLYSANDSLYCLLESNKKIYKIA